MENKISHCNVLGRSEPLFIEASLFKRNLWVLSVFSLPVIYLGLILAVFIHEVVGHGLTAALLGGRFNGFGILLDGMGWANIDVTGLSDLSQALMFFSGAFYTTVFAALFFTLSAAFKRNHFITLAFLFFAITSLLDGLPYFFWDAIYLGGIGDFSMIWFLYHNSVLRITFITLGGFLMVSAIVFFNVRYYKIAYSWLGEGKSIKLKEGIILSSMIFLLQALAWFLLDWNQLIPGIGSLPNVFALAIVLITLIPLTISYKVENDRELGQEISDVKTPISVVWIVCAAVIFVIMVWLQKGVIFS